MQTIETAALGVLFGAVPVIACFLGGWWISIPLNGNLSFLSILCFVCYHPELQP
jgi:hypothetical protein